MTALIFLRMVLTGLVVIEAATALVVAFLPVAPEDLALAGDVTTNCTIAALIACAMLVLVHFVDRRSNG